jgi:hypothetical protein
MVKRLVALAALALAMPAQAQDAAVDPDRIAALLRDAGNSAEYFTEEASYRQILSESGGYQFLVELYDCDAGKACTTLEFFAGFPMEEPPTEEALDGYSGLRDGARIYLDRSGHPSIQLPVELTSMTDAVFLDRLKTWEAMMAEFAGFLAGEPVAAEGSVAETGGAAAAGAAGGSRVGDAT